jgi:hypothetical protein
MESLQVTLGQHEDTLKQQAKKTADLEAQRSAVDEKLVQHVRAMFFFDGLCVQRDARWCATHTCCLDSAVHAVCVCTRTCSAKMWTSTPWAAKP